MIILSPEQAIEYANTNALVKQGFTVTYDHSIVMYERGNRNVSTNIHLPHSESAIPISRHQRMIKRKFKESF